MNVPLTEGVALRVASLSEDNKGFVKNIGSGNDSGGEKQKFVRGTLNIEPPSMPELEVVLRASCADLGGEGQAGFGYKQ